MTIGRLAKDVPRMMRLIIHFRIWTTPNHERMSRLLGCPYASSSAGPVPETRASVGSEFRNVTNWAETGLHLGIPTDDGSSYCL